MDISSKMPYVNPPRDVNNNRWERIWMMAVMDFKLRYYENKLGLLWALIKPLSQLFVYYLVFSVIMKSSVENYAIYLFSGLIVWHFFVESSSGTISILRTKKYLYEYTNMRKIEIYIAALISNSIGFTFNLTIYLICALAFGVYPSFQILWFPIVFINVLLLGLGTSLILSNLYLLFRDIDQIWSVIIQFLMFLSPLLYNSEAFRTKLPFLMYLNPLSGIMDNTRHTLMYSSPPDFKLLIWGYFYAGIVLMVGFALFKKISPKASEILT